MQVETSKANKLQLDYGLAKVMGADSIGFCEVTKVVNVKFGIMDWPHTFNHLDPATCMVLMKEVQIAQQATNGHWRVASSRGVMIEGSVSTKHYYSLGSTLAEAVTRLVIKIKLGDKFECPDELGGVQL